LIGNDFTHLQFVPTMPPILACRKRIRVNQIVHEGKEDEHLLTDGPGSTGKKRPVLLIFSFKSIHETAGWTTMSMLWRGGSVNQPKIHIKLRENKITLLHAFEQSCP